MINAERTVVEWRATAKACGLAVILSSGKMSCYSYFMGLTGVEPTITLLILQVLTSKFQRESFVLYPSFLLFEKSMKVQKSAINKP